MNFAESVLIAEIEDLEVGAAARPYADAPAFEIGVDDGGLSDLDGYTGKLPLVLRIVGS